ncbi:MAG: MtnX-like HAD-IB family phosphatase [Candidatus Kariarchaeaceae archaeon]
MIRHKDQEKVILCDFDGTILNQDTGELILEYFVTENWKIYDEYLKEGKISLEECIAKQFRMVKAPAEDIIKQLEEKVVYRNNFEELRNYCMKKGIDLVIVSAGLDFVIEHFLQKQNWTNVQIIAAKSNFTKYGIEFSFPERVNKNAKNFKDDFVISQKTRGKKVIYIGDGLSDYEAVRSADFTYVIKGTMLEEVCKKEGIKHFSFIDFSEIIEDLSQQ